jgi:Trk K+ transport system NAD-binding subunit
MGYGFFIPIFFIMVGVRFNLAALASSTQALFLVPLLLGAAILVKLLPTLLFRLRFSWRETLAAGSLLSARLSLIIAASAIGLRLGVIGEEVNAAIILVAILTVTFAPLLFIRLAHRAEQQTPPIIIASAGELGILVAEQLRTHGESVVLFSLDAEDIAKAQGRGLHAVLARLDQADPAVEPYLSRARALICTSSDMAYNYRVCQWVRATYGIEHLVVQVNDPQEHLRFTELGAVTFNPALDRVPLLALLARNPGIYELLVRNDDDKEVAEVAVRNADYTGRKLLELKLPGDLLILAVRRRDELLVPHGHIQLKVGDRLTLIGSLAAINQARWTMTEI